MRDPQGVSRVEGDWIVRCLRFPLASDHFLHSPLAAQWVAEGTLIGFEWRDAELISPRLPFVTAPDEWCDAQFHDAARLTLELQKQAVDADFDLKDASAWNIIFDGCGPVFCDLLSFTSLTHRKWWAAGQYARHFLLPLLASRRRGLAANRAFAMGRDGLEAQTARRLLGPAAYLTRYGSLLLGASDTVDAFAPEPQREPSDLSSVRSFRRRLHAGLDWMLAGVAPSSGKNVSRPIWSNYLHDRSHYGGESIDLKRQTVGEWLMRIRPAWVADLGCNTGEFSTLAAESGAQVIALDSDHDSVEHLYRSTPFRKQVHPVLARLDDMSGGRGWAGVEHPGLVRRLEQSVDVVMMLALIHHLAIGASIPLEQIAAFASACTRRWLIVELIDETDPQSQSLCAQRQRDPAEFSLSRQRNAFLSGGFHLEGEVDLLPTGRVLLLLRKVTA